MRMKARIQVPNTREIAEILAAHNRIRTWNLFDVSSVGPLEFIEQKELFDEIMPQGTHQIRAMLVYQTVKEQTTSWGEYRAELFINYTVEGNRFQTVSEVTTTSAHPWDKLTDTPSRVQVRESGASSWLPGFEWEFAISPEGVQRKISTGRDPMVWPTYKPHPEATRRYAEVFRHIGETVYANVKQHFGVSE